MNFNKDYPIAILDTNIVMDVPNILYILKGCNIVIPFTLIEELDNHKKENKGARDFVNNFLSLSEKANLSKDGYKLENDCMLYLDMDKNNLRHKEIDLSSKKQDIKFIAEAKNLKEKYSDMEVVLISSDKIMKITASTFDVKVKNLEEFLIEYLKLDINELYELAEKYDYIRSYKIIYKVLLKNEDINRLYELVENKHIQEHNKNIIYKKICEILSKNKDLDGLYKLSENDNIKLRSVFDNDEERLYKQNIGVQIFKILSDNKDIDGLYKFLKKNNKNCNAYKKIYEILSDNKDVDGLYGLAKNDNYNSEIKRCKKIFLDKKDIYEKIFEILSEDNDINGLYELTKNEDMINAFKDVENITITDVKTGKSVKNNGKLSNRICDRIVELEKKLKK